MIEYTPTTNDVREFYEGQLEKGDDDVYMFADEEKSNAEFDRWLAGVKAEAWDEGYDASEIDNGLNGAYEYVTENPYREVVE